MDLLHEIVHCPIVQQWFTDHNSNNPCALVISSQRAQSPEHFQVPEPWSGDVEHAPILFLSSNPTIDESGREEYPRWAWSEEWIADFFFHRFGGGRKQWIDEDGIRSLQRDGSWGKAVRFWTEVRSRARELLERDVRPGVDYALTEVVHCKSRREMGVPEALPECARRYLQRVVKLSGARVLVTLGKRAKVAVQQGFSRSIPPASEEVVFGPIPIGEHQRYIVFLPHPNAHMKRTFEASVGREKLQILRAFLRSQISEQLNS